jgi:uncharacterized membrane protein YdbT with pleckstrin-like domain
MSYVEGNLIPGEKVVYKTGLHWVVLVGPITAGVLLGLPGLALSIGGIVAQSGSTGIVGFILLAFGGLCFLFGFLGRKATEMAVTNKRVIVKTGLLSRRTFELLLSKVESIGVDEAAFGRMLGYGSVVVRGTGGTPEPFTKVSHPLEFRRQVQQQIETSEQAKIKGQLVAI